MQKVSAIKCPFPRFLWADCPCRSGHSLSFFLFLSLVLSLLVLLSLLPMVHRSQYLKINVIGIPFDLLIQLEQKTVNYFARRLYIHLPISFVGPAKVVRFDFPPFFIRSETISVTSFLPNQLIESIFRLQ